MNFRSISFNEAPPNQGQMTLAESALAQPFPILFSLTPLGVSQPIVLESGGQSSVELTFDLGGLLGQWLAKTEKKLGFSLSYAIANGAFTVEGGSATAANPGGRVRVVLSPREADAASVPPAGGASGPNPGPGNRP